MVVGTLASETVFEPKAGKQILFRTVQILTES